MYTYVVLIGIRISTENAVFINGFIMMHFM